MQYDLDSAREAAGANSLETWVHDYLQGPGRNQAFSDGLRLRQRYWRGPLLLPTKLLNRKCGPEPGMPFHVSAESWSERIAHLAATFVALEAFPPLLAEYRSGELLVSDGNHRLGAFTAMGIEACWVIIWYPDESERAHFEASSA
jgi:hypothetical protein